MTDEQRLNDEQAVASGSADTETDGVTAGGATADGGVATEPGEVAAGASAAAAGSAAAELEGLRTQLEALNDRYLRLAAEFDNYRKRMDRERGEAWTRAQADLAARLLESLDDLQRVAALEVGGASLDSVLEGIRLVERKLRGALEAAGLVAIEAVDGQPFDPSTMEALMTVPAERPDDDDVVADVFQKGYLFKETLIRPARVRVRKYEPET